MRYIELFENYFDGNAAWFRPESNELYSGDDHVSIIKTNQDLMDRYPGKIEWENRFKKFFDDGWIRIIGPVRFGQWAFQGKLDPLKVALRRFLKDIIRSEQDVYIDIGDEMGSIPDHKFSIPKDRTTLIQFINE